MGFLNSPVTPAPKPWREDPIGRAMSLALTAVVGVLLGMQYWNPNKRVLPVVAALLVFGVAWRLSMVAAVNVLVFLLPFPKGTVFGSTNLAFIMIVFVIWLLRLSLHMSPPARSSPLNLPIFGMLLWYVLSFYNVRSDFALERALQNFELFVACVVMYYLVVNSIRTQRDLERLHMAQLVTALVVFVMAILEARLAGRVLIPGLVDFSNTLGHEFNTRDVRVGSTFRDYELMSEYTGIVILLATFLFARARTQMRRLVLGSFILLTAYTMFTTVTRGVFVALGVALPYMFYVMRRRLNPVRFVSTVSLILALAIGMNFVVANYTNSGDTFSRLFASKLVHGIVPEAREKPWENAWRRSLVHPIIGQGPYYDEIPGYEFWWPHNVYLFIANLIGFPGLGFFLMIVGGLFVMLRPLVDRLDHESYADSYLIVARAQLIMFLVNELKIDYLRNPIYQFQIWLLFGTWTAAYLVSRDHGVRAGAFAAESSPPPEGRLAA